MPDTYHKLCKSKQSSNCIAKTVETSATTVSKTYYVGELFAGAGGMALGAHRARYKNIKFAHVWVNDCDRDACQTFSENFPTHNTAIHCCDVSTLGIEALPRIDGLVFGFPCNDFSIVGSRKGVNGKFGGLYQYGIHALKTQRPLFFVAENVNGISSSGDTLHIIENEMTASGYKVFKNLYKFENFGVPQRRHRIIMVGFRNDTNVSEFSHPNPTTLENPISCEEALQGVHLCSNNNEPTKHSEAVIERLKHIKPGQNIFTANIPQHLQLKMTSNATISQIYRRLIPDRPSYTVTGSGGGGTHIYHWSENRALTNRERARLQTFPDDFLFVGGKESVRKQIGMAVPPLGARHVFESIMRSLAKHKIDSQCIM